MARDKKIRAVMLLATVLLGFALAAASCGGTDEPSASTDITADTRDASSSGTSVQPEGRDVDGPTDPREAAIRWIRAGTLAHAEGIRWEYSKEVSHFLQTNDDPDPLIPKEGIYLAGDSAYIPDLETKAWRRFEEGNPAPLAYYAAVLQYAYVYNPLRILEKDVEEDPSGESAISEQQDQAFSVRGSVHPDTLVPLWLRETLQSVEEPIYLGDNIDGELDYEVEIASDGSVVRFRIRETSGPVAWYGWRWEETEASVELPLSVQ